MAKKTSATVKRLLSLMLVLVITVGIMAVGLVAIAAVPLPYVPGNTYNGGDQCTYNGKVWQAKWNTKNAPSASLPEWMLIGDAEPDYPGCQGSPIINPKLIAQVSAGDRLYIGYAETNVNFSSYEGTLRNPAGLGSVSQLELKPGKNYVVYMWAKTGTSWFVGTYNDCALISVDEHGCVRMDQASFTYNGVAVGTGTLNYKIVPTYGGFTFEWVGPQPENTVYLYSHQYLGSDVKIYGKGITDSQLEKWATLDKNRALKYDDYNKQGFSVNYNKDMIAGLGIPARSNGIESLKNEMADYYPSAKLANDPYMIHDTYDYSEYYLHDRYVQGVWDTMPAAFGWEQDEYTEPGIIVKQLYDTQYNITGKSYGLAGGGQNPWVLCDYLERNAGYYDYATRTRVEGTNAGSGWYKGYDEVTQVPYLWYPEEGIFLSYENVQSLTKRCQYVNQEDLGGIIIWELSGDNTATYPMITAMKQNLDPDKKIVGYFTNWSVYNEYHQNQRPEDLPLDMLTHVNYSFFQVGGYYERGIDAPDHQLNSMDRWADDYSSVDPREKSQDMIPAFAQMKQQYPDFKLLISVGGWTRGNGFHDMVSSAANRKIFVDSVKSFLTKYPQFDGVDLDWEYPSTNRVPDFDDPNDLGSPADGGNFDTYTALCKELRAMLNTLPEGRRELTACIPAAPGNLVDKQNLTAIANECTFVNAMTYDYHGAFDPTIGYNSPLYPSVEQPNVPLAQREWATSNTVKFISEELGVPKSKINIGTPFYSRGWAGVKADADGNPQPITDPTPIFPLSLPTEPSGISVTPTEKTIEVGDTFSIAAAVMPASANQNITWTMDKSNIVTVSGGTVVGMQPGKVIVTATTVNGLKATCTVTVKDPSQNESNPYAVVKVGEDKWYNAYSQELQDCGYDVIIEDGKAFLPFRFAGELLGGEVFWEEPTQTAILRYEYFNYEYRFTIGSNVAKCYHINGDYYPIFDRVLGESEVPFISNGRTYLPARVLADTTRLLEGVGTDRYITYKSTPNGEYLIFSFISQPTVAQVDSVISTAEAKL